MPQTLKLQSLSISIESSYSFKFISLSYTTDNTKFSINYSVKEDDFGNDLDTVEVKKVQKSDGKEEKVLSTLINDKMINLVIKDLENIANHIETDNLILWNNAFEACDCPTKVVKYQKFRDDFVEALKNSKVLVTAKNVDFNAEGLLILDPVSLEIREDKDWRWQVDYYPDDLPRKICYSLPVGIEVWDVWKLTEIFFLSKDAMSLEGLWSEFFFYHPFTIPNCKEILENFEIKVRNEPVKKPKKTSIIHHTQLIRHPLSPFHIFIVMISDNAISGTTCTLGNLRKTGRKLIGRHSKRQKINNFWPFFAMKSHYE